MTHAFRGEQQTKVRGRCHALLLNFEASTGLQEEKRAVLRMSIGLVWDLFELTRRRDR